MILWPLHATSHRLRRCCSLLYISTLSKRQQLAYSTSGNSWCSILECIILGANTCIQLCFASQNPSYCKTKQESKLQAETAEGAKQGKPFACAVISIRNILLFCYVNWKQFIGFRASAMWQRSLCKVGNYTVIYPQATVRVTG